MPTNTTRRRSTKSLGYEGRSESVLMPAKRASDEDEDEAEDEEVAEELVEDVEAIAGPREATPSPPDRCEAAVSSLTSASRLLVGLSPPPPAGVAAGAAAEELRRGRAGSGRRRRGGRERDSLVAAAAVSLALVCLRVF